MLNFFPLGKNSFLPDALTFFQVFEGTTLKDEKFERSAGFITEKWRLCDLAASERGGAVYPACKRATRFQPFLSQHACASCRKQNKWRRVESNRRK
jgi:hypothetical protein